MSRIIHVVNSDFGYGFNLAVHSWRIAQGLKDKRQLVVFCRAAAPGTRATFDVRPLGLGRTAGRFLKAVNLFIARNLPYRRIEDVFFEASLKRALQKPSAQSIAVVHTWTSIPRILTPLKRRNPSVLLVKDITMAVADSGKDRAEIQTDLPVYDYFFSPSAFVSESLAAAGVPANRIVCIPYGVDPQEFRPRPPDTPRADFRVAFSGLVCARKGIPTLLEAWKQLDLPGASLNLYGRLDPALSESLRDAGRHNIFVRGFVDLKSELPQNDLFVFPSAWEGSAKAVYEALACGLPVVTTHNAGSVVQDGVQGFIIPVGDVSALAAKIRYFYDNRQALSRFSSEARRLGLKYSWSRYAETVIDCYHRLAPVVAH